MSSERNRYAVFLDRDGTLIEDRGHLANPSEVHFLPGAMEALRRLREDFLFFLVTKPGTCARRRQICLPALRRLDAQDLNAIAAFTPPESGFGRAIADRLRRASCSAAEACCGNQTREEPLEAECLQGFEASRTVDRDQLRLEVHGRRLLNGASGKDHRP